MLQIGPSFAGHQPVFNSQSTQLPSPQAYIHPNGPIVCSCPLSVALISMSRAFMSGLLYSAKWCIFASICPNLLLMSFDHHLQYGQQVILGQPRPVYYMPTYPPVSLLLSFVTFTHLEPKFDSGFSFSKCILWGMLHKYLRISR